jgi:nitronate monooxygenase
LKEFNIGDLRIPVPIIQGGMGIGISLSRLASAVANMGGVGVISTVGIGLTGKHITANYRLNNIDTLREEIRKARGLTLGVLGVNIMSVITDFADMVKTSVEEGIDIIFSGAGLPLDLPKYIGEGIKTKLVPIVSSARAVSIILQKWIQNFNYIPDAFVLEGPKAGGHLGFKRNDIDDSGHSLERLVSDMMVLTAEAKAKYGKEIPIIAAGGIYSGGDMYDIMKLGASAVQLGTRFVATEECDASSNFKDAFVKATDEDVEIIQSPVGMPGRALHNQFLQDVKDGKRKPLACRYHCIKSCDPKTTPYCIASALLEASRGNLDEGFVFTGSNAGKVDEISTVQRIFDELAGEYNQAEENS